MTESSIRRRSDREDGHDVVDRADGRSSCPECEGQLISDEEHAETVCAGCGLVVHVDELDRGPEWRASDATENDKKSRVGSPTTKLLHDEGLSTNISWQNVDAHGTTLSSERRRTMKRLRTWNKRFRTRGSKERNLQQALGEISRMASALGLPKPTREMASVIYRRALDDDLVLGRSIEGVATASLYAAARKAGTPRSLDEVSVVSRVEKDEIGRTYRYLSRDLSLKIEPADPESYVPRFVSELELSDETQRRACRLLERTKSDGVQCGKSPVSLAASAVYAAAQLTNEGVTQYEISDVANVSEVTIRNRYHELLEAEADHLH
ncbi:transcription initiation factor IIB [Natrialbaceae archaeon AArc-T1-2]|uniref:transcription initiation factor IIB n=1 Tax=Natrialbaceae archaeon AArc-T1-2 TaxID=3053904 RepID=UPI00255AFE8A|nr:TFIIB-type zinc ribbon-containing protein [Natrialbaceae archaeon AArc-T1-2]WIV68193.1 TFIIB-type zinc ribbon-containing protein [Natrialbaceae archaeon AArc-T1-2]